jgi:hypothetical protein
MTRLGDLCGERARMMAIATGPNQTFISVWNDYALLLESLNSCLFASDTMLRLRGRTVFVNPDVVREICYEVILASAPEAGGRDEFAEIIRGILLKEPDRGDDVEIDDDQSDMEN